MRPAPSSIIAQATGSRRRGETQRYPAAARGRKPDWPPSGLCSDRRLAKRALCIDHESGISVKACRLSLRPQLREATV
jgi:hypothetical protein